MLSISIYQCVCRQYVDKNINIVYVHNVKLHIVKIYIVKRSRNIFRFGSCLHTHCTHTHRLYTHCIHLKFLVFKKLSVCNFVCDFVSAQVFELHTQIKILNFTIWNLKCGTVSLTCSAIFRPESSHAGWNSLYFLLFCYYYVQ